MNYKEVLAIIKTELESEIRKNNLELTVDIEKDLRNGVTQSGFRITSQKDNFSTFLALPGIEDEDDIFNKAYAEENMKRIVNNILNVFSKTHEEAKVITGQIMKWERSQDAVLPVLFSKEEFSTFEIKCPHRDFLDMVICYLIHAEKVCENKDRFFVTNTMAEQFGIDEEILYSKAMENMEKNTFVEKISEIIARLKKKNVICGEDDDVIIPEIYVIRCNVERYGAGAVLNKKRLNEIAKKFGTKRLVLIPSSLHECMVLDRRKVNTLFFKDMIREVNQTHILPEDVLSNSLYYYDVEEGYGIYS